MEIWRFEKRIALSEKKTAFREKIDQQKLTNTNKAEYVNIK